jgi:hypothetical protein
VDPRALLQPAPRAAAGPQLAAAVAPLAALHVRGKSGLKHTKQLLDCWVRHPMWPVLTVVGPMPNEQISGSAARAFMAAANVRVPQPGRARGAWVWCGARHATMHICTRGARRPQHTPPHCALSPRAHVAVRYPAAPPP